MVLKIFKDSEIYTIYDVKEVSHCNVELSITFNIHHRYNSIEEILKNLPPHENINFRFKGVNAFHYNPDETKSYEDGETSLVIMIKDTGIIVGR